MTSLQREAMRQNAQFNYGPRGITDHLGTVGMQWRPEYGGDGISGFYLRIVDWTFDLCSHPRGHWEITLISPDNTAHTHPVCWQKWTFEGGEWSTLDDREKCALIQDATAEVFRWILTFIVN